MALTADEPRRRPPMQRVPPHDLEVERNLLGAAMLTRQAAAVVALMSPDDFYKPAHSYVAEVIGELHAEGSSADVGTVAAVLRQRGALDSVGGANVLLEWQGAVPHTSAAAKWADMVTGFAHRRRMLGLLGEMVEAVYSNVEVTGLVAELADTTTAHSLTQSSSWDLRNLALALAGEGPDITPVVLTRTDGVALLYPGKVHSFIGEPESGKSWLALLACVERISLGEHVVYVDYEADDVTQVTRLLELGCTPEAVMAQFHYIRPDEPVDATAKMRLVQTLEAHTPTLCVVDGVAEALALNGWKENDASDVTAFYVAIPRLLASQGAAVVTIDHVVKDREAQGRYARGSTAKLAAIDGAVYKVEVIKPFARGQHGTAKVVVTKDRHGFVRAEAVGATIAELHLDSAEGCVRIDLAVPKSSSITTESGVLFRPTHLMQKVSDWLERQDEGQSSRAIREAVAGKGSAVDTAVTRLVEEGYVATEPGPRGARLHRSVKSYRETMDPILRAERESE